VLFAPLTKAHDRAAFDCGDEALNHWFKQVARQHRDKGISSTFVAVADASSIDVLGYYSLSLAELVNGDLPATQRKLMPQKIPAFRLGRLAVSLEHQGRQIGQHLLFDAIDRATRAAKDVGGVGIVVNAKPTAVGFYQQYGFEMMADHPHNLFLLMADEPLLKARG
jgi:GNAT superfamily N-acetyltransferase